MSSRLRVAVALVSIAVLGVAYAAPASARATAPGERGRSTARATRTTGPVPLLDKGGRVLASSSTYAIYWGTWADPAAGADLQSGMTALLSGFDGSDYLNTATQYMRGAAVHTQYVRSFIDTSAPPSNGPSTATIVNEVAKVLKAAGVATDPNAVYFVYTSNLPKVNYCAWHSFGTVNGTSTQVAYMPFTANSCFPTSGDQYSHNSWRFSTKALADSTAHEFMEAITDPETSSTTYAWIDKNGAEIGDKCNYVYTGTVTLKPTLTVPSNTWQIQSEWSNATNACAQTTPIA